MHMEMEDYIKMQSDSQPSGHKVPGLTGNADSMVPLPESPVNRRRTNEPEMDGTSSLVKQDPPDGLDVPRSAHSVENIYEHIQ